MNEGARTRTQLHINKLKMTFKKNQISLSVSVLVNIANRQILQHSLHGLHGVALSLQIHRTLANTTFVASLFFCIHFMFNFRLEIFNRQNVNNRFPYHRMRSFATFAGFMISVSKHIASMSYARSNQSCETKKKVNFWLSSAIS